MPSLVNLLKDVDVEALSLVPSGANGQRIFLYKCDGFRCPAGVNELPGGRILKADDWSAFYIVVAEPGSEEKPGMYGDQSTVDVWADEDEIRKAAWRFMANGGLVNKLHEDMQPFGQLVENAVAHSDFTVQTPEGPHTVRKGSWYVAVAPTDEGRRLVESGELGGVSIQGTGTRFQKDAALVPNKPGVTNWVERTGGLPKYIADIAGDLISERGKSTSQAIQLAVGIVQRWCRGEGDVKPETRAKSCAALAEWEAKRAAASGSMAKVDDETWSWANSGIMDSMEKEGLLERIGKALGITVEKCDLVEGCECHEYVASDEIEETVQKAALTAAGRKALPKGAFVFPAKAPGSGSYPIHDRGHAIAALARSKGKPEEGAVHAAVCKRFKDLPACQPASSSSSSSSRPPFAKAEGLREDGDKLEAPVDLAERVEQIEKDVKGLDEKFDSLTADDSPIMKGIQDLKIRFEEKPSPAEGGNGDGDGDGDDDDGEPSPKEVAKSLEQVADGQEMLAKTLLDINEQVEKMADRAESRQVDEREPVAKQDAHPLAGLLS